MFVSISVFLQDSSKYSAEIVTSPSLDVFLPEDEDNPYESVTTAVTRKPCSLDISHRLAACTGNGKKRSNVFIKKKDNRHLIYNHNFCADWLEELRLLGTSIVVKVVLIETKTLLKSIEM